MIDPSVLKVAKGTYLRVTGQSVFPDGRIHGPVSYYLLVLKAEYAGETWDLKVLAVLLENMPDGTQAGTPVELFVDKKGKKQLGHTTIFTMRVATKDEVETHFETVDETEERAIVEQQMKADRGRTARMKWMNIPEDQLPEPIVGYA